MENKGIDKKLFFEFIKLLESHNIFFWLDAGTLLGAYRDKSFISHDDDIDISLWMGDYWKVRKIIDLTDWKYKSLWRTEIAVYHESNPDAHIDLFFHEKNNNDFSTCVYLENKLSHDIQIESKVIIPGDLLNEFKHISFYNHKFNIPKQTDRYLTCHYGNWRIKETNWYYSKKSNIDRNHCTVAIIIPTFLRDDKLINCINSILRNYEGINRFQPFFKIYIGEQAEISKEKEIVYQKLKDSGHQITQLPYNCGLSYARNTLIEKSTEPYILVIDDDYIFNESTQFEPFFRLLLEHENIGIVGGKLSDRETLPTDVIIDSQKSLNNITYITKPSIYLNSTLTKIQKSYRYFESNLIPNFFMAKREIFDDIRWDNELKLVEHSDFFIRLKQTKWKVLFTPDASIEHHPENNSNEYKTYRDNKTGSNCINGLYKFRKKYNLTTTGKFITEQPIDKNFYLPSSKIKIVQIARIPCANSGLELNNLINKYSQTYESRYILGNSYSKTNRNIPFREFPTDLFWENNKEECLKILSDADIIHVHHDIIDDPQILNIVKNKKVVWTLYNLSQSLQYDKNTFNIKYINKCYALSNVLTVADQSLQRLMFSDITDIKVPLIKMLFNETTKKDNIIPHIVFSPTNKLNTGIATKKYPDVLNIIEELKNENYNFTFDLIEGLPYKENLERKRKADILIDDVDPAFEKFHNSSIEAACFGAITLTNYSGKDYPFIKTNIHTLKETLIKFISNPTLLKNEQNNIIQWKNENYNPEKLLKIYDNLYTDVINGKYFIKENAPFIQQNQSPVEPVINKSPSEIVIEIMNIINNLKIKYWFLENSCLEIITQKKIISNKLIIGVPSIVDKNLIINNLIKYSTFVDIHVEPKRQTKEWKLYGMPIKVPFPLIKYLEHYTQKTWETIQKENKNE